jgi:hypothetical protein
LVGERPFTRIGKHSQFGSPTSDGTVSDSAQKPTVSGNCTMVKRKIGKKDGRKRISGNSRNSSSEFDLRVLVQLQTVRPSLPSFQSEDRSFKHFETQFVNRPGMTRIRPGPIGPGRQCLPLASASGFESMEDGCSMCIQHLERDSGFRILKGWRVNHYSGYAFHLSFIPKYGLWSRGMIFEDTSCFVGCGTLLGRL